MRSRKLEPRSLASPQDGKGEIAPNVSRRRLMRWLAAAAAGTAASCGEKPTAKKKAAVELRGLKFAVSIEENSPIAEALRNGLNDFEARTGSTVELQAAAKCQTQADLCVFRGDRLFEYPDLSPLGKTLLESKGLYFDEYPSSYRTCFAVAGDEPVAVPLGVDELVFWRRADLLSDRTLNDAFRKQHGSELGEPGTWENAIAMAELLKSAGKVEHGFAFACDGGKDAVRCFLAVAASLAKTTRWSSFAIDTENAKPRLSETGFVQALELWLKMERLSISAGGKAIADADARRMYQSGKVAFLITSLAPPIGQRTESSKPPALVYACGPLPGSKRVFAPRQSQATDLPTPNRCAHHGTTGWLMALGKPANRPAAERLLQFLASPEESVYLVQAAKRGFVPVRSRLLNEPARFTSYGMPAAATGRYLATVSESMRAENWVADLRLPQTLELERALGMALDAARTGKKSPVDALADAQAAWEAIIHPLMPDFLRKLRASLALPAAN